MMTLLISHDFHHQQKLNYHRLYDFHATALLIFERDITIRVILKEHLQTIGTIPTRELH
jgi:hypothetical protein